MNMQTLLLEDIKPAQMEKLRLWLAGNCQAATLPDTFWLPVPEHLLGATQTDHLARCGPFCLAILLDSFSSTMRLELLLRPRMSLHCSCFAMADNKQREFALNFWDNALAAINGPQHDKQH